MTALDCNRIPLVYCDKIKHLVISRNLQVV